MNSPKELLTIAVEAARIAAQPLKHAAEGYRSIHMEEAHDVKLQADLESERKIREYLNEKTDFPIIGEEEGGDDQLLSGDQYYWVVDPLDGTYNYLREIPQCCVSIGLMKGMEAQLGAVFDFNRDEIFTGGIDLPLIINEQTHTPRWAESRSKAIMTTGFPHEMDRSPEALNHFMQLIMSYKKVRMIGSAALSVAYVAAGYMDVYYETGVKLWDIAAGLAFAQSTGVTVQIKHWEGNPLHMDIWYAGKPEFIEST